MVARHPMNFLNKQEFSVSLLNNTEKPKHKQRSITICLKFLNLSLIPSC